MANTSHFTHDQQSDTSGTQYQRQEAGAIVAFLMVTLLFIAGVIYGYYYKIQSMQSDRLESFSAGDQSPDAGTIASASSNRH